MKEILPFNMPLTIYLHGPQLLYSILYVHKDLVNTVYKYANVYVLNQDSSVSIVIMGGTTSRVKNISLPQHPCYLLDPFSIMSNVYWDAFPGVKRLKFEVD
jgi:hypothetical protein